MVFVNSSRSFFGGFLATYNVKYVDMHWPLQQFYLTMSVEGDLHVQLLLGR